MFVGDRNRSRFAFGMVVVAIVSARELLSEANARIENRIESYRSTDQLPLLIFGCSINHGFEGRRNREGGGACPPHERDRNQSRTYSVCDRDDEI